jgi:hypothetical protein
MGIANEIWIAGVLSSENKYFYFRDKVLQNEVRLILHIMKYTVPLIPAV